MKTTSTKTPPVFLPVAITLTFESQKELDAFGSFFNNGPNAGIFRKFGLDPALIYNEVMQAGGDITIQLPR